MLRWNTRGDYPQVDESSYIDDSAVIIGKVLIGKHVFIGPGVIIRADEPGSFIKIDDNCNIQDRVIIHSLIDKEVIVGRNASITHGCIVHGPCKLESNCFIGFGSVIFDSNIGEGAMIMNLCCIEGVSIPAGKLVTSTKLIHNQKEVDMLTDVTTDNQCFSNNICKVNFNLVEEYIRRQ